VLVFQRGKLSKPSIDGVLMVALKGNGDQVALAAKIAGEAVLGSVERSSIKGGQQADLLAHHYEVTSRRASSAEPLAW
jgi:hypothetical protein